VEGFRQRGSKKASKKPVKRRIKRRVARARPILPKVPATIEAVFPSEGVGFFDAWDAEEFYLWAAKAKKALEKTVPLKKVENLWRSIPIYEMASVDGDRSTVITYADGEAFIIDVEDALRARPLVDSDAFTARELQHKLKTDREQRRKSDTLTAWC